MNLTKNFIKYVLLAPLIIILGVACNTSNSEETVQQTNAQNQQLTLEVDTARVLKYRPIYTVKLPGELQPYESVDIHAKVRGFVKDIYVDIGDEVKQGQLLALLEAPELNQDKLIDKANQEKLKTQYNFSKQNYERLYNASLSKKGAIAEIEIERAYSKLMADSAAYLSALSVTKRSNQINDYLQIRAPFSGIIVARNVSVGALVGENNSQSIFSISQNEKLRLTVSAPEIHSQSVYDELESTFSVIGHPDKEFTATLSRSASVLNSQDRSLALQFDVANKNKILKGGDYAEVKLALQRRDSSFFVPTESIINSQSGTFILIANNQTIKKTKVKTGINWKDKTEVFGPLQNNDIVVKKGTEELYDEQIVNFKQNKTQK